MPAPALGPSRTFLDAVAAREPGLAEVSDRDLLAWGAYVRWRRRRSGPSGDASAD